ncbi:MAG: hypothetical protein WA173_17725 [Pseudomonas sp.]|uniref:hypothetical protein n=1 Tax=Pseudomonas sp. TaxID=306 RepID=UPI003BB623E3
MWRAGLLALLLLSSPPVLAVEPLTWMLMPFPGGVNVRNGQLHDGFIVEFLRLLDGPLSDVAPQYQIANIQRSLNDMAHGRNLCSAPYQRSPERDQIGYFVPLLISPPVQLVVRASDVPRLPLIDGRLWLDKLLAADLRGGFFFQRIYPPQLQARLPAGLESGQLIGVNQTSNGDRLLLMLGHRRFDYTFEYPLLVAGFTRANPQAEPLRSLPVADLQELPVFGSYCTRNEWGRGMAQRIDGAMRGLLQQPQSVEQLYRRWLPADSYQAYRAEIQAFLRQRGQSLLALPRP